MLQAGLLQKLHDARHQRQVGAAQEAEAQPVGVFIGDGANDGLGRLPETRIDDMHARVAQAPGPRL